MMQSYYRMVASLALTFTVASATGCASVYIQPDTNPPTLRGHRFYYPRPYIVVLKPFPVAESSWVLPGKIAPDGIIVGIDQIDASPLKDMVLLDASQQSDTPFLMFPFASRDESSTSQITATSGDADEQFQSGFGSLGLGLNEEQRAKLLRQLVRAGSEVNRDDAPTGGNATGWIKKGDISELRDPVNDLFEIRYLPDMSQRYVLVGKAGLGTAKIDAYLSRGWLVHHYGTEVDRAELGRSVFGNIQAVLDIARVAGKTALIASTGGLGAIPVAADSIVGTSGEGDGATASASPRDALLRFTVIEYAVPGVYPILRRDEMRVRIDDETKQEYYELEISGSFQQPASAALPVGYRTTKVLIVSALRNGEDPTANYRIEPTITDSQRQDELAESAHSVFEEVISELQIPATHVTFNAEENPTEGDTVELIVTVTRTEPFSDDELWNRFGTRLAGAMASTETFPGAARVQLKLIPPLTP